MDSDSTHKPGVVAEETPLQASEDRGEMRRALWVFARFVFICGIVWLAAFWINSELFYIKPGSEIMYDAKADFVRTGKVLDMSKQVRVLVIGNSKVMSGFLPAQFEQEIPGSSAYNWGKPNATATMDDLAAVLQRGQIPTYVLFAVDWKDVEAPKRSFFHPIGSDRVMMDKLFPFRDLIRNGIVFLLRSRAFGGPRNFYRQGEESAARMNRDQGYYFIVDQSRFPNHQLPADFHLDSDAPDVSTYRQASVSSQSFQQLNELALKYGFKVLIVPYYLRKGEAAAPGVNREMVNALQPYHEFTVMGDEYYLFDNHYFSDLKHLNPDGARMYTGLLAGLVKQELDKERGMNAF